MNEITQGTEEWFECRRGKVTASKVADIMSKPTLAGYRNYLAQLTAERLTGKVEESYTSFDMQRGIDLEPEARDTYAFEYAGGFDVVEVGFVDHPTIPMMGCSPDGLVGDAANDFPVGADIGLVEIKCPKTAQHQDLLLGGNIDGKYIKQMQFQMACTGAKWCDYCSYDPTMPLALQLFVKRVERDEKMIAEIEKAAVEFLEKVSERAAKLEAML